jgi:hypothetical protein
MSRNLLESQVEQSLAGNSVGPQRDAAMELRFSFRLADGNLCSYFRSCPSHPRAAIDGGSDALRKVSDFWVLFGYGYAGLGYGNLPEQIERARKYHAAVSTDILSRLDYSFGTGMRNDPAALALGSCGFRRRKSFIPS